MARRPIMAACGMLVVTVLTGWSAATLFAAPPALRKESQMERSLSSPTRLSGAAPARDSWGSPSASAISAASLLALAAVGAASGGRRKGATAASAAASAAVGVQRPADAEYRSEREKGPIEIPAGKVGQRLFSVRNLQRWNYIVYPRTYFMREWKGKDIGYAFFFAIIHAGAAAAPFYFTWQAFYCFLVGYLITGMFGITLSYHRQLAHRSFTTPKWLEYTFAYCGALALQSHPINWVSSHRHHHGGTETESDVHSPLDGFWWSHCGWLMDAKNTWMRQNKGNASDLQSQWFYRFLQTTYPLHAIVLPIVGLYAFGGLPCVLWGFFARVVWVWHMTWMVNSVSHVWGFQDWNTGDKSMNNWVVGMLAFGEGWHNNHHAFENSCRHGLKWWMVDPTWYTIKLLSFVGLANNLKYPSEGKMRKLAFPSAA
mmetsp:Transcript_991/g.1562  ORF Transcript_991/g.1562 Transcript_991/m.1562 type:complete len:428 (+) Transcript_991:85-1368(+)